LSDNSKPYDPTKMILEVIHEKKPHSIRQLTEMLRENLDLSKEEIAESVLKLQAEGVIKLENLAVQSRTFTTYLKTIEAVWYWLTIAVGSISAALVFLISESLYPWIYARNILGLLFVLFLPGYSFIKLFQDNLDSGTSGGSLKVIERITFSVGMSLALISIVGLLLYYSPWGLDLVSMVPSLLAVTLIFSTAAVIREYRTQKAI
jgi:hypothetical protein